MRLKGLTEHIRFTNKDILNNKLPFLDCAHIMEMYRNLIVEVHRNPTPMDQYPYFDCHHLLKHKLRVIRTLHNQASTSPPSWKERKKRTNTLGIP